MIWQALLYNKLLLLRGALRIHYKFFTKGLLGVVFLFSVNFNSWGQNYFVSLASGNLNALATWTNLVAGTGNITTSAISANGSNTTAGSIAVGDALFDNSNNFIGIVTATPTTTTFTLQNWAFETVTGVAFKKEGTNPTAVAPVSGDCLVIRGTHNITVSAPYATTGTIVNNGTITTPGNLTFSAGGTYIHYENGGAFPIGATWNATSTCYIYGIIGTAITALTASTTFGNFTWNCPGQTSTNYLVIPSAVSTITIAGNFYVANTNNHLLDFCNTTYGTTLQVNGNFTIGDGTHTTTFNLTPNTAAVTVNIGGNVTVNASGTLEQTGPTSSTINLGFTGATASSSVTWGGAGTYTNTYINYTIQNVPSGKTVALNSNMAIPAGRTLTVNSGATLNCGTSVISGAGRFTLSAGGILGIGSTTGLNGNITTTTATYNPTGVGTTFVYNGTAGQVTGTNLPTTVTNLTLNNSTGLTLSAGETVNSTLMLTSGVLALGNNNLIISNDAAAAITDGSGTFNFSKTNMIGTDGTGYLIKNATSSQALYPIGTGTNSKYSPVSLTTTAGGTVSARSVYGSLGLYYLNNYWDVQTSVSKTLAVTATFNYDASEAPGTSSPASYVVFYSPNHSTWTTPPPTGTPGTGTNSFSITGTTTSAATSSYWTAGNTSHNYYSYQSGNWNSASTWTTDPSGTLWENAGIPGALDNVVILNGRNVYINSTPSILVTTLQINLGGTLDIENTTGHNFGTVSGQGVLRINSSNIPSGTFTNFVSSAGGTIEYYDVAGSLSSAQTTYNNLKFSNSTAGSNTFVITNPSNPINYTVNGSLTLTNTGAGALTLTFGNAATNVINMTVNGNITVGAGCTMNVATTTPTPTHTLTVSGDFTNNGTVKFTDQVNPNYTANTGCTGCGAYPLATGIVNVTFSGLSNNTLTCNGITNFFRFILNKGTDQTYMLTVNSSNTANFKLFAPNNISNNYNPGTECSNTNPIILNALWIENGTLQLTGSIYIPSLVEYSTQGEFYIPQNGALWVNGPNVTVYSTTTTTAADGNPTADNQTGSSDFKVAGTLRVTNGLVDSRNSSGIIYIGSGEVIIEGGTVNIAQFRHSQQGSDPHSTFNMSGGTLNILGQDKSGNGYANSEQSHPYCLFDLPHSSDAFIMSGGTINISGLEGTAVDGAIMIMVGSGNYNVTGGTTNITLSSALDYGILSTAPLYNLNIYKTGTGTASISNTMEYKLYNPASCGTFTTPVEAAQALHILNNFYIDGANNPVFNCNNDIYVGGIFTVSTGSTLSLGTNRLHFNGSGAQTFNANGTFTGNTINKIFLENTSNLLLAGNNITVADTFSIGSGCTFQDGGLTLFAQRNIVNSGTHFKPASGAGSIQLTGTNAQIISGNGSGSFNNLTLNKTGGSVTMASAMAVTGELRLAGTPGAWTRLNIGANALTLGSSAIVYSALTGAAQIFNTNCMIQTTGLMSDDGVTKTYSNTSAFLFPFGFLNSGNSTYYYMPASIRFSSPPPTTYGSVTTRPVDSRHPLAQGTTNALTCYWKTTSTGFSGITDSVIHQYYYDYAQSNYFVQGTESNYVPAVYRGGTTWTVYNNVNKVNNGTNQILYDTAYEADGEYTAGYPTAFTSIPVLYSSATPGNWTSSSTWSSTGVGGTGNAGVPGPNTLVIIGDATHNHYITMDASNQWPEAFI